MRRSGYLRFSRNGRQGNFKIELFVIRVGDWGGYLLLDCDDPTAVHKFCSMLPAFVFEARPVIPIDDAVRRRTRIDCFPRWAEAQVTVQTNSRRFIALPRLGQPS